MKHRITHSVDLHERFPAYAAELGVSEDDLKEAFDWMLNNDVAFRKEIRGQLVYSLSLVDIEPAVKHPLAKRFYHRLKQDIPARTMPLFGLNWPTFRDRFLRIWEQTYNIIINKIPSHNIRIWWLRLGGAKIGKGSSVWRNTEVLGVDNLRIGEDSVVAWHCQLDARSGLVIGDHVAIASHVLIIAGSHDMETPEFWGIAGPIYIEDYAWIASRVVISHSVRIGRGAALVANAVISRSVEPYKVVGGNGSKLLGERPHNLNYKVGGKGLFNLLH